MNLSRIAGVPIDGNGSESERLRRKSTDVDFWGEIGSCRGFQPQPVFGFGPRFIAAGRFTFARISRLPYSKRLLMRPCLTSWSIHCGLTPHLRERSAAVM